MSSTASSTRVRQGREGRGAPDQRARRRRPTQSSIASIATTCWASTSSGLRRHPQRLDLPARASARRRRPSARGRCGTSGRARRARRPRPGAPRARRAAARWPRSAATRPAPRGRPRPCRCRARGERRHHGGQPAGLQLALDEGPLLLATEPWWARASTAGAPRRRPGLRHHLRRGRARDRAAPSAARGTAPARPSPSPRRVEPLGPHLVEPRGEPLGQPARVGEDQRRAVRRRRGRRPAPPRAARSTAGAARRRPRRSGRPVGLPRASDMSSDRHDHGAGPTCLSGGGWTIRTRRGRPCGPGPAPPSQRATSSTGRTVADSPTRWAGRSSSASSRSRLSARCAPRLEPASACTSSRITVSTPASEARAGEVSSRNSDSGVVMSTSGGVRAKRGARRRGCRRSGRRPAPRGDGQPEPGGRLPDPGERRAQVALDVDGQRLERGDVQHPAARAGVAARRPVAARPAGPAPTGRPPASCPTRSGRRRGRVARADRLPGADLGGGGRGEGTGEPRSRRRGEPLQNLHVRMMTRTPDSFARRRCPDGILARCGAASSGSS